MRFRPRRFAGGAAGMLAATLALAACGSDARYLSNEDAEVYLKLTDAWTTIPVGDSDGGDAADATDAGDDADEGLPWQVVFDRAAEPDEEHFGALAPAEPVGLVVAGAVSPTARDTLSLAHLRSYSLGGHDPLELEGDETTDFHVLGNIEDYEVNGHHGNRVRFSFVPEPGGPAVVIDQVAVTDPGRRRVFVVQVKCEAACFERHQGEIDEIIESFHIGGT